MVLGVKTYDVKPKHWKKKILDKVIVIVVMMSVFALASARDSLAVIRKFCFLPLTRIFYADK